MSDLDAVLVALRKVRDQAATAPGSRVDARQFGSFPGSSAGRAPPPHASPAGYLPRSLPPPRRPLPLTVPGVLPAAAVTANVFDLLA